MIDLRQFLSESNKIEGIYHVWESEPRAAQDFLDRRFISVINLTDFVKVIQPDAQLRDQVGLDVMIGNHRPVRGGPRVRELLTNLLEMIKANDISAYRAHIVYEGIHPFTDGNGRSGRLLWLWQMQQMNSLYYPPGFGFLHAFYYQTLRGSDDQDASDRKIRPMTTIESALVDAMAEIGRLKAELEGVRATFQTRKGLRVADLLTQNEEWEQSFNLYDEAMRRGTKLWQEKSGYTKVPRVWPDGAKLIAWLMERLEKFEVIDIEEADK